MARARYLIVQTGESWVIRYEDEEFGPYKSQSEAFMFAVEAAKGRGGEDGADVGLLGENGHVRNEWTSEHD